MAKKHKNEAKAARKERARAAKEAKKQAEEEARFALMRRRQISGVIGVLTLAIAVLCYWVLEDRQLTGVVLLVGSILFLMYALSAIGAAVKPKDRNRASAIDFGNRD